MTFSLFNKVSDKYDVLVSIEIIMKIFNQQQEKGSIISINYIIKLLVIKLNYLTFED